MERIEDATRRMEKDERVIRAMEDMSRMKEDMSKMKEDMSKMMEDMSRMMKDMSRRTEGMSSRREFFHFFKYHHITRHSIAIYHQCLFDRPVITNVQGNYNHYFVEGKPNIKFFRLNIPYQRNRILFTNSTQ